MFDGAINVPIDELRSFSETIEKDKTVILYCQSGTRSYNGERMLRQLGFDVYNLDGSYSIYNISKKAGII